MSAAEVHAPAGPGSAMPGRLAAAVVVDGVGTGMFLPFSVLFFVHVTGLPLPVVGACLTGASLLALPTSLLAGPLIDRFGPVASVVAGNLLCAAAYAAYPWVSGVWQLLALTFLAACGQTVYWTANAALIAGTANEEQRAGWFARQSSARNAGYAVGAVAGAAAVAAGSRAAYLLLVVVNVASFLGAAALMCLRARDRVASTQEKPATVTAAGRGRYRSVLRQRSLWTLTCAGVGLVLCMNVLPVLLTSYVADVLARWAFLGGLAVAVNTVLVVVAQAPLTDRVRRHPPVRVMRAAAAAWAAAFGCLWALAAVPRWLAVPCLLAAVAALTLAEMLYGPTANALATRTAPNGAEGRHLAVFQLSWSVGSAIAPAVLTWLLAQGPQWPWTVLLGVCALCAAALSLMPEATPLGESP